MRVTVEEVRNIIDTALVDLVVYAYIESASVMVTGNLAGLLSADMLKEVERWLAAHMIASTQERTAKKEGAGGAYIEYTGEFGQGLRSTPYGQMVLNLDNTGTMAGLDGKKAWLKAVPQN